MEPYQVGRGCSCSTDLCKRRFHAPRVTDVGCGALQVEVGEMLNHYRMMTQSAGKLSQMTKNMNPRGNQQQMLQQMSSAMPPQLMRQMQQMGAGMGGGPGGMGGMAGMQELMKQMQSMGGMPGGMKF